MNINKNSKETIENGKESVLMSEDKKHKHPRIMNFFRNKGPRFLLVLAILAFIYSIGDIIYQIQVDIFPRLTSWIVFFYSLTLIILTLKNWNKRE